ncbi:MAG: hypothetical protein EA378_10215 [Phycisphaerales bacterium]|nr:MAG: hypothetical protein EA378_10215 [Phycisphaerales bacterium]
MSEFNLGDPLSEDGLEPSPNEKLSKIGVGASAASGGGPKTKISAQQVVLLAVLVIGGGLLFGMRKLGMGPDLVIADPGITYEPRANARPTGELERLMSSLEQSSAPVQIPLDSVERNPFEIRAVLEARAQSGQPPVDEEALAAEAARKAAAERERQIQDMISRLALQSTMDGRVPVARINNEFYRIGDRVATEFMLVRIDGRTAVLSTDDGQEFVLIAGENRRQQPQRGGTRRR